MKRPIPLVYFSISVGALLIVGVASRLNLEVDALHGVGSKAHGREGIGGSLQPMFERVVSDLWVGQPDCEEVLDLFCEVLTACLPIPEMTRMRTTGEILLHMQTPDDSLAVQLTILPVVAELGRDVYDLRLSGDFLPPSPPLAASRPTSTLRIALAFEQEATAFMNVSLEFNVVSNDQAFASLADGDAVCIGAIYAVIGTGAQRWLIHAQGAGPGEEFIWKKVIGEPIPATPCPLEGNTAHIRDLLRVMRQSQ